MRLTVVLHLIGLVLICPFACGAAAVDGDAPCSQPADCCGDRPTNPVHCPEEGASCFCQGAIVALEHRFHELGVADVGPLGLPHIGFAHTGLSDLVARHASWNRLGNLGSRGDASIVLVLLQAFRC